MIDDLRINTGTYIANEVLEGQISLQGIARAVLLLHFPGGRPTLVLFPI